MLTKLREMDEQLTSIENTAKKVEGEFQDSNQVRGYIPPKCIHIYAYIQYIRTYIHVIVPLIDFFIVHKYKITFMNILLLINKIYLKDFCIFMFLKII